MKYIYKLKIYFIFLTSFLFWYSCASNKPNETENHPEIEKLWIEYFNNLNENKFDEAVSYLNESVLFSFDKNEGRLKSSSSLDSSISAISSG